MGSDFIRTAFAQSLLLKMARQRASDERQGGRRLAFHWNHWTDGMHPELRARAPQIVIEDGVKLHSSVAALNSSMAFAFNLFMPFRAGDASPLAELLSSLLRLPLSVESVQFEYVGSLSVLAETSSDSLQTSEPFTSADVAVHVRDETGRSGVVLIEVKLSEGHFSLCNGVKSASGHGREACDSAARFLGDPSLCYLRRPRRAARDRRYWNIFEAAHGSVASAFPGAQGEGPCPFRYDSQQPMRNHALMLGLVQSGRAEFGAFILVHHDLNPDIVRPWDRYAAMVADPECLVRCPASKVMTAARRSLEADPPLDAWLNRRYFIDGVQS